MTKYQPLLDGSQPIRELDLLNQGANMAILHEVKLVPEVIAEGTNGQIVISPLATLLYKHIPIAQSIAEHFNIL